ncbi:unnamed protein product [Candida verbasci]|uniref:Long chronological lifespan protein 2 n=1 Tax=Candida verbasci TaxID=1227364 RepID=A0A9W4TT70_9ASCO|nr:unnamed protein product [Candida verbasci]
MYMLSQLLILLSSTITFTTANLFDFLNNQFHSGARNQPNNPKELENQVLNSRCNKYLCPDTKLCVEAPKFCPCPYPSSQIRCFLPNDKFVCISKPSGEGISEKYNSEDAYKLDAKDDNIRDCGWVKRAWNGLV